MHTKAYSKAVRFAAETSAVEAFNGGDVNRLPWDMIRVIAYVYNMRPNIVEYDVFELKDTIVKAGSRNFKGMS